MGYSHREKEDVLAEDGNCSLKLVHSLYMYIHLVSCMYINMYAFVCLGLDQLFPPTIHLQLVYYAHVFPCIHERNFLCCHRNQDTWKLFSFLLKVKCSLLLPFWPMMYVLCSK